MSRQVTLIVLDSVGIGEAADAAAFGDTGSDTLGHIADAAGPLELPNLRALGLGNIARPSPIRGCGPVARPAGFFGRMNETAPGKDTATGHWEMMGLVMDRPFETFPDGFPADATSALAWLKARNLYNTRKTNGGIGRNANMVHQNCCMNLTNL